MGYKFRRQHPLGRSIVDFVCIEHRLVIEADGGQHNESKSDEYRTAWLERQGWRVLRFWNNEVRANSEGVQETILEALNSRRLTLPLLRNGSLPLPFHGRGAIRTERLLTPLP